MFRLLRLGVTLAELGYTEMPGPLGDWLIEIEDAIGEVAEERRKAKK